MCLQLILLYVFAIAPWGKSVFRAMGCFKRPGGFKCSCFKSAILLDPWKKNNNIYIYTIYINTVYIYIYINTAYIYIYMKLHTVLCPDGPRRGIPASEENSATVVRWVILGMVQVQVRVELSKSKTTLVKETWQCELTGNPRTQWMFQGKHIEVRLNGSFSSETCLITRGVPFVWRKSDAPQTYKIL